MIEIQRFSRTTRRRGHEDHSPRARFAYVATLICRGLKEGALIEIARTPPSSNRAGVPASIVYADRDW
jgi:hypothetical protein